MTAELIFVGVALLVLAVALFINVSVTNNYMAAINRLNDSVTKLESTAAVVVAELQKPRPTEEAVDAAAARVETAEATLAAALPAPTPPPAQ